MNYITLRILIVLFFLAGLIGFGSAFAVHEREMPVETTLSATVPEETVPETTLPPETTVPETQPQPERFVLSFAGDCTLGSDAYSYGYEGSFVDVVGENYSYPFQNVRSYFAEDDLTLVNLEGVFCDWGEILDPTSLFNFRGPESYINILTEGCVDWVHLANNHSMDYGLRALNITKELLEEAGIGYGDRNSAVLVETESGLKVGIYSARFNVYIDDIQEKVAQLREQGAQIIVASIHWGGEGVYKPYAHQVRKAHAVIDAGVDILYGHHPHVLQPIEYYNDGIICYSLGNFSFGGNLRPSDLDSAILQLEVIRDVDGTISLGELTTIPVCCSGTQPWNDFCPTPYEEGSEGYDRVISKLDGSWKGRNIPLYYNQ